MTEVLRVDPADPDPASIVRAAECLRRGGLVAFPTETVYGLGAHALDPAAVRRIFAAKERPAYDPLIVHIAHIEQVEALVAHVPDVVRALAARFWPGPLTMVLRRSALIPNEVTAGLDTVAIRIPSHAVALALLKQARLPVAAPSANRFSRPSPTRAAHVLTDLDGRIDVVVDGGATMVGVESTVVDLTRHPPVVLRPGAIAVADVKAVIANLIVRSSSGEDGDLPARSPGMLQRHYAPATLLTLFEGEPATATGNLVVHARDLLARGRSVAVLAFAADVERLRELPVCVVDLGDEHDAAAVASRLYAALREGDELGTDVILVRNITTHHPLSMAIQDRLRRAATPEP